jgi:hypothetical protein
MHEKHSTTVDMLLVLFRGTGPGAEHLEEVPIGVEWSETENRIMFFMGKCVSSFLCFAAL